MARPQRERSKFSGSRWERPVREKREAKRALENMDEREWPKREERERREMVLMGENRER